MTYDTMYDSEVSYPPSDFKIALTYDPLPLRDSFSDQPRPSGRDPWSDEHLFISASDNTYDPGLADGWERFDDSSSEEPNDWDDDTASDQENIPSDNDI